MFGVKIESGSLKKKPTSVFLKVVPKEKKKSKKNPVAKSLYKFNKPKVFKDKSKYNRKKTIKEDESTQ